MTQTSVYSEARNLVVIVEVVRIAQAQGSQRELGEESWDEEANVEQGDLVENVGRVHEGLHPVGLGLVDVLVPKSALFDNAIIIVFAVVKALRVREDN